jgi:glycosyltransferase involved in cell wall biosynthesis
MANKITAIILHYNRQKNIPKVIAGIRAQTVPCDIWVWDNSGNYPVGSGEDVYLKADKNTFCLARYLLIKRVETEYIFNTDDDISILDNKLFEKFIAFSERHQNAVIGWNGRKFHKEINWEKPYSYPNIGSGGGWVDWDEKEELLLDVINFGVSFLPTRLLKDVPLDPYTGEFKISEIEFKHSDDIWISKIMGDIGIEKRVMPFNLKPLFEWLDEGKVAISKQSPHMTMRDGLCKRWWRAKYD